MNASYVRNGHEAENTAYSFLKFGACSSPKLKKIVCMHFLVVLKCRTYFVLCSTYLTFGENVSREVLGTVQWNGILFSFRIQRTTSFWKTKIGY